MPTLVRKQKGQVISIAILGGHGFGDVSDIDLKCTGTNVYPWGTPFFRLRRRLHCPVPVLRMKLRFEIMNILPVDFTTFIRP